MASSAAAGWLTFALNEQRENKGIGTSTQKEERGMAALTCDQMEVVTSFRINQARRLIAVTKCTIALAFGISISVRF